MKILAKKLLAQVAGGLVAATTGNKGGGSFDGGGSDGIGGGGGFDGNGIGANSCVAMPAPAQGLFGYTFTETVAGAGAVTGVTAGLGQGVGASLAIETAGGWTGVGGMGAAAAGLVGSATLGLSSASAAGYLAGTAAYNNSETIQLGAQSAIAAGFFIVEQVTQLGAAALGIDRAPQPVYIPKSSH